MLISALIPYYRHGLITTTPTQIKVILRFLSTSFQTDVHLHCEEWDRLLSGGQWQPENLVRKLPEFLEFVKEVQCFVVAALKSNGVERKGKIDEMPWTPRHGRWNRQN